MSGFWDKLKSEITWRLLLIVSTVISVSVRKRVVGLDRVKSLRDSKEGGILAVWHGSTVLPIYVCRNLGLWAIVSKSGDGELMNRHLESRGFKTIRGSTGTKGIRAFLEASRRIKGGAVVCITPDGPRGPNRVVEPGVAALAERSGCAIIPVGVVCEPVKRLKSWDSYLVPMPFGKSVIVFGEPFHLGDCSTDEQKKACINQIASEINSAEDQAKTLLADEKAAK